MPKPHEKLAASLAALKALQEGGAHVFKSSALSRVHRERLLNNGFVREIIKGWLMACSPQTDAGDTTPWFSSFWAFCARYCADRFQDDWVLSPEQSLLLHAENRRVPRQVVIHTPKGTNHTLALLFGASLFDYRQKQMPTQSSLVKRDGLNLFTIAPALVKVPEAFFRQSPVDAQIVLAKIRDGSEILTPLLDGGHSVAAGRLAGAFRHVNRSEVADEILSAMKIAGYDVRERDPFFANAPTAPPPVASPPIVHRIQLFWTTMRDSVLSVFEKAPGLPSDKKPYLLRMDDLYERDAYHSLSIEGYQVTPALIEKVAAGDWDPDQSAADRKNKDALAARGYYLAFQKVKETVGQILTGQGPGKLVRSAHGDWYRQMFGPHVQAGLMKAAMLAGYRNGPVFIRGSRHVPPRDVAARDAIGALFDLIEQEDQPAVRAVLGHWLFGYIHPYPDGNGRIARFLMNALLASGGYPWTVIRMEDRGAYLDALESASVDGDIEPFAQFIAGQMKRQPKA